MATNRTQDSGIIILGNAGTGKSFLCNILIGNERFKSEFESSAVTTETEHQRMSVEGLNLRIYNIPGLIEAKKEAIERNKREITKAFAECPNSIVLFVWGHVGGRLQPDDVIAFKALNEAYQFPKESLAFVVNNLDPKRKADYDGKFMVDVKRDIAPLEYSMSDFIFIDKLDEEGEGAKLKYDQARLQLVNLIRSRKVATQKKHKDIDLEDKKIKELRELLEKEREAFDRDREKAEKAIRDTTVALDQVKKQARQNEEKLRGKLEKMEKKMEKVDRMRKEIKQLKKENESKKEPQVEKEVQEKEENLVTFEKQPVEEENDWGCIVM